MRVACAARPASDFRRLAETVLSGERRLPACNRRQLADDVVFGKAAKHRRQAASAPRSQRGVRDLLIRQGRRHAMTPRKPIHQTADPFRKTAQIFHQIGAKTGKGNLRRCDHKQGTQKHQVHHINKKEGKKCPVVAQIGLVLRNHPAGEGEVKGPGNTERRIEQLAVGSDIEE